MDVPLQCHWEVVIIISRNSHRSKQITPASGRCLGRHRVWNFSLLPWQLLFACLFIYLPTTFSLWGKETGFVSPSFVWVLCSWRLSQVSVHQCRFWIFRFSKKALSILTEVNRNFAASFTWTNTWFPAQKRCEAGVVSNKCTQQSCFQRCLIHPCRSLQFVSN